MENTTLHIKLEWGDFLYAFRDPIVLIFLVGSILLIGIAIKCSINKNREATYKLGTIGCIVLLITIPIIVFHMSESMEIRIHDTAKEYESKGDYVTAYMLVEGDSWWPEDQKRLRQPYYYQLAKQKMGEEKYLEVIMACNEIPGYKDVDDILYDAMTAYLKENYGVEREDRKPTKEQFIWGGGEP